MEILNIVNEEISKLFEVSFHDFSNDDILNNKYLNYMISNESYINDDLLYYFKDTYGFDDENDEKILKSPEFKKYVKDYLEQNLETAKENIFNNIKYQSNNIYIYRAITVDGNWLNHLKTQGKRLGIYWSWSPDGAETHWGDYSKKNVAIITAVINEKYVNWLETFWLNIHPSTGDEKEIRLYKNTPLNIISISINGNEIDLSELNNKTFYS